LEVPTAELESAAHLVKREMEGVYALAVPLEVGVAYGSNWRDVTSYVAKE
jgi:DNA polymerase I-like protein with 3'-5' exonuclease and polymerase domains